MPSEEIPKTVKAKVMFLLALLCSISSSVLDLVLASGAKHVFVASLRHREGMKACCRLRRSAATVLAGTDVAVFEVTMQGW